MTLRARISLPTYDALTDTNPDHYALFADQDNILIKEFTRGSGSIVLNNGTPPYTIAHNLGYVPFFLVFVFDTSVLPNKWKLLPHYAGGASVPPFAGLADTTNLYLYNYYGTTTFKWYIFYDFIVSGTPTFTHTGEQLAVSKSGVNVLTDNNPNDYIFHSSLNTFKILKEANVNISYTVDGVYTFNHNASLTNPTSYMVFMKFPDGYTALLPGKGIVYSKDSNWNVHDTYIDTTQIGMTISGTNMATTLPLKYYVFETPLS